MTVRVAYSPQVVRMEWCQLKTPQEEPLGVVIVTLDRGHEARVVADGIHVLQGGQNSVSDLL